MKITKTLLKKYDACEEGIEEFKKLFPNGFDLKNWTLEKQLEIIKSDLRKYFGWAVFNGIIPIWSMRNADLWYADLRNADLWYADLSINQKDFIKSQNVINFDKINWI